MVRNLESILCRRHTRSFFKDIGKIMGIAVAHVTGDLVVFPGGVFQEEFRLFHALPRQCLDKSLPGVILEN